MKPLLDLNSPLYLKRLVRKLNETVNSDMAGFYASVATFNVRCSRARLANGNTIQCYSPSCSPVWFTPIKNSFVDPYGRQIVASRHT